MGIQKGDKAVIAAAAVRVSKRSNSHITEVIEPETEDGRSLSAADRFAAGAAAFFYGGACYFVCWFLMGFKFQVAGGGALGLVLLGWRLPIIATAITTVSAFIMPKWTYRVFGKLMKPFEYLF